MNYYNYNPYYYQMPNIPGIPRRNGLFKRLFSSVNFNSIITNTGKVLQVANQAIPLVKQVSPVVKNAKTMFRVMNEFKKSDNVRYNTRSNINKQEKNYHYNDNSNGPTFFA